MKKLLMCLVALGLIISACLPVIADGDKVEINFCVGDDTLIINGTPVKVEKPYVLDIGVTLVPVRVITEAFDAKVDWVDETQTVILTYPDVNITIQIGNPIAEVNGRAVEMLAAPELTESGYTMVPLRFISENFGADVFYDEATERITVTKEKTVDSSVIEGSVNNKYIGDSHYKWSMENPLDMTMEYRDFDGFETVFSDGENEIEIEIFVYGEDYDFENDYNETKMSMSDLSLVKNEKDTSDENCKKFRLGAKDKNTYYDYQQFVTKDYIYSIEGELSNADPKVRDEYLKLLSTFVCEFEQKDIYDLSNVKDGFKRFESEYMKLSFDVPDEFCMASSEDAQNDFSFYELKPNISESVSSIEAVVYSKSDVESAEALAQNDYEHNKTLLNEELAEFGPAPKARKYSNISAIEYSYTLKSQSQSYKTRDVFFEIGDYVYNFRVDVELPNDECDKFIDRIIESIKAEQLDSEEIGVLMRNIPISTGTVTAKLGKMSLEIPNIYIKVLGDESTIAYMGPINGVTISCIKTQVSGVTTNDLKEELKTYLEQMNNDEIVILRNVIETPINKRGFVTYRIKKDENVMEQYACLSGNDAYIFTISCHETTYSKSTQSEIMDIIQSIKFE